MLNLGVGEGDYDGMIVSYGIYLIFCDLNEVDVVFV